MSTIRRKTKFIFTQNGNRHEALLYSEYNPTADTITFYAWNGNPIIRMEVSDDNNMLNAMARLFSVDGNDKFGNTCDYISKEELDEIKRE